MPASYSMRCVYNTSCVTRDQLLTHQSNPFFPIDQVRHQLVCHAEIDFAGFFFSRISLFCILLQFHFTNTLWLSLSRSFFVWHWNLCDVALVKPVNSKGKAKRKVTVSLCYTSDKKKMKMKWESSHVMTPNTKKGKTSFARLSPHPFWISLSHWLLDKVRLG